MCTPLLSSRPLCFAAFANIALFRLDFSFNFRSSLAGRAVNRMGASWLGAGSAATRRLQAVCSALRPRGWGGGRGQVNACSLGSLLLRFGSETRDEKFIFQFRSYFWLKIRKKKTLSGESNVHLYLRNSLAVELLCVLYSSCQSEGFALSFSARGEILQLRL